MENIKLPFVHEKLFAMVNDTIVPVTVKSVKYEDTKDHRKVTVMTDKGEIKLWDLCESQIEAYNRILAKKESKSI